MTTTPTAGQLQQRAFQIRSTDTEKREFTGIGVPYGEVIEHFFGRETFEAGSVELDPAGARVLFQHGEPIGLITHSEETPEGFRVTGKISATRTGDEAMTLLRDGVIRSLSIGFEPTEWHDAENVRHWTKVQAREFSLVTFPAYDGAAVESIREQHNTTKEHPMAATDTLTRGEFDAAIAPLQAELEDTKRAALQAAGNSAPKAPSIATQFRTIGDFAKALARGDEDATQFHREYYDRAYTGGTTADTVMKDSFLGDQTRLLTERRPIINQFTTGPLPADGLTVDYVVLGEDTTKVAKQAGEGADLPFGKLTKKLEHASIDTYGGAVELSRQEIERASVEILNTTLDALSLRYARVTNAAVKGVYTAQIAAHLAAGGTNVVNVADPTDPFDFLDSIVDAADIFEDRGYGISRLDVSKSVFKKLLRLATPDRLLTDVNGSNGNTVQSLDLGSITGNLAGIRVNLLTGTGTEDIAAFVDPVAIKTLESGVGSLQDENIINLTKDFSIYGYMASFVQFPDAILPLKFGV